MTDEYEVNYYYMRVYETIENKDDGDAYYYRLGSMKTVNLGNSYYIKSKAQLKEKITEWMIRMLGVTDIATFSLTESNYGLTYERYVINDETYEEENCQVTDKNNYTEHEMYVLDIFLIEEDNEIWGKIK